MTTPDDELDDMTELVDADFPRVDLVGKGANGIPRFLIAKQDNAAGLLEPDFVRDLIAKAGPAPADDGQVTMTGSPAGIGAVAAAMYRAAEVAKAKNDTADRERKAASGAAMPDGSYPIASTADLDKAIRAVGRGGADHDVIRRHVIQRAKSLGASSKIPDNWAADGSLKEDSVAKAGTVTKADMGPELDEGIDGMDPTVPLAAPEDDAPGDPTDPGSPAWEAIDAASACKWTSILSRAKVAIGLLADREMLEAASADPSDAENACDLQDVCCAIDYAISVLAPFAVAEQSAADVGADAMAAIGKAMASDLSGPLGTIEALAAVAKAGRVLSAANESRIRDAAASLQGVLASLPSAPLAADEISKKEAPVADAQTETGQDAPAQVEKQAAPEAAAPEAAAPPAAEPVAKADGDGGKPAQVAVYDASGNLVGVADPADITPLANVAAPAKGDDPDEAAAAEPAEAEPAEPPADPADMTPAPPADAGTPAGDDVAKAAAGGEITRDVLKSVVTDAVSAALESQGAAHRDEVAKMAASRDEQAEEIRALKGRLETVEAQPAAPRVFTNGQVPPAGTLRGQDQGGDARIDVAKAREMKQRMYTADPAEANVIHDQLNRSAIASLEAIHAAGRQ